MTLTNAFVLFGLKSDEEIIEMFTRDQLVKYYSNWYGFVPGSSCNVHNLVRGLRRFIFIANYKPY